MIAGPQTVVVHARTTRVTAICEACLDQQHGLLASHGYRHATVEASLSLEHDHGWATCARGHEIRLIRAGPPAEQQGTAAA